MAPPGAYEVKGDWGYVGVSTVGMESPAMGPPPRPDVPFARELFVRDALRRGAIVLQASAEPRGRTSLVVNGQRRTEQSKFALVVVSYEGGGQ